MILPLLTTWYNMHVLCTYQSSNDISHLIAQSVNLQSFNDISHLIAQFRIYIVDFI